MDLKHFSVTYQLGAWNSKAETFKVPIIDRSKPNYYILDFRQAINVRNKCFERKREHIPYYMKFSRHVNFANFAI